MPHAPKSPQDVYGRLLLSARGYPLWTPEPSNELLIDRREGLRIGDVGVVLPEDGGFEVFFNICLPHEHPFHSRHGVPEGFTHIEQDRLDIRSIRNAENAGRIISTSSVATIDGIDPNGVEPSRVPDTLNYTFCMSTSAGAVLILPEGAERYHLQNEEIFVSYAAKHGDEWYRFAKERLGRIINEDSLYLITGFHKTSSWSVAAYSDNTGNGRFDARFKTRRIEGDNTAAGYTWDARAALEWRAGPGVDYGIPNQAVFIRGLKIALRTFFLRGQWISVKADAPGTRPKHVKAWGPVSGLKETRSADAANKSTQGNGTNQAAGSPQNATMPVDERDDTPECVKEQGSEISQPFHPSNVINRYLLSNHPAARIAVTCDSVWIEMVEKGLLQVEDLEYEDRLMKAISEHYHSAVCKGCVSLESLPRSGSTVGERNCGLQPTEVADVKGGMTATSCSPPVVKQDPDIGLRHICAQNTAHGSAAPPNGPNHTKTEALRILGITDTLPKSPLHSPKGSANPQTRPRSSSFRGPLSSQTASMPSTLGRSSPVNDATSTVVQDAPKHRNIVFIGEAGTGKSSTINLILGAAKAAISNNATPCTTISTCYKCQLNDTCYKLWDTRGLGEASFVRRIFGKDSESTAKLKKLLHEIFQSEGIDLLVYCVRASRATKASQRYYNKFCSLTRRLVAPVVIVATESEKFENMEDWWKRNESQFQQMKMGFDGHACITVLPEDPRAAESRRRLVELIAQKYDWEPQGSGSFFGSTISRSIPGTPQLEKKSLFQNLRKMAILNRKAQNGVTAEEPASANGPSTPSVSDPQASSLSPQRPPSKEPISGVQRSSDINCGGVNVTYPSPTADMGSKQSSPSESSTPSEYPRQTQPTPPPQPQRKSTFMTATRMTPTSSTDSKSSVTATESPKSTKSMFSTSTSSSRTSNPSDSQEKLQSPTRSDDEIATKVVPASVPTTLRMKTLPSPRRTTKQVTLGGNGTVCT